MKTIKKIAALVAVVAVNVPLLASTVRADQPRMHAAKENLENAMKYLKKPPPTRADTASRR